MMMQLSSNLLEDEIPLFSIFTINDIYSKFPELLAEKSKHKELHYGIMIGFYATYEMDEWLKTHSHAFGYTLMRLEVLFVESFEIATEFKLTWY